MASQASPKTDISPCEVDAYVMVFAEDPCRLLTVHPQDEQFHIPFFRYDSDNPYSPALCRTDLAAFLGLATDPPPFRIIGELMPVANDEDFLCAMHNPNNRYRLLHLVPASNINLASTIEACSDPQIQLTHVPKVREAMFDYKGRRRFRTIRHAAWTCYSPCGRSAFAPSGRCAHTIIDEMASFLTKSLRDNGLEPIGCMERQSRFETKSVFKIRTQDGLYYIKEGYRGSNEVSLTTCIAKLFPSDTLELLSADKLLNCFVARGFSDRRVYKVPFAHTIILKKLARMQMESVDHLQVLKEAGVPDMSPKVLASKFAELAADSRLDSQLRSELESAIETVESLCAQLESTGIPNTLVHGDFAIRNIAIRKGLKKDDGIIFFDWESVCISHPFCDLSVFFDDWKKEAMDEYLLAWLPQSNLAPDQVKRYANIGKVLGGIISACHYLSMASKAVSCDQLLFEDTAEHMLRFLLRDVRYKLWKC